MFATTQAQRMWIKRGMGLALGLTLSLPLLPATAQDDSTVEQSLSRPDPLADRDKLAYAQDTVQEIEGAISQVQREGDEARKARDILKLNCLNEKLTDLKALYKVTETALAQLDMAIAKAKDDDANHEFEKIVIARKRAQDLVLEAKACTGEGILSSAEGPTSVSVSADITGDGTTVDANDPFDPGLDPPQLEPDDVDTPTPVDVTEPPVSGVAPQ